MENSFSYGTIWKFYNFLTPSGRKYIIMTEYDTESSEVI